MSYEPTVIIFPTTEVVTGFCACCGSGFEVSFTAIGFQAPGLFGSLPDTLIVECPVCEREWEYPVANGDEDHEHNRD